jgi:hypothetical protein
MSDRAHHREPLCGIVPCQFASTTKFGILSTIGKVAAGRRISAKFPANRPEVSQKSLMAEVPRTVVTLQLRQ